ncbi:glycosyltransferase family 2 protein [Alicyclobacillus sp. ALC3]|uniref:glycosyltransferase family 2 protein n=1 Tax=Alicyclobacillus sp. ALC3 TaxID=2796143 RepID=UPI00237893FE|nr:glycosyltransferase family 2 protein [Alicyclobacillus sp. ALC3]WDL95265.1 glycosyltransferase family 2 protein [Alicyclobacillus sp. ALC3]
MDGKPLVSVIMAAFNVERYIERAIRSALEQTVPNIEVIVVDDCSTDKTLAVVRSLADPRIKLYKNTENRGPSFSRNHAISKAEGQWLAVLDADDWWTLNRLEDLLEVAEQYNAEVVCDDLYLIEDGADVPWIRYFQSREKVIGRMDDVRVLTPHKMVEDDYAVLQPLIHTNFLLQHDIHYKDQIAFGEDYVFLLDCLVQGAKAVIDPRAHYYYRSRPGSLTQSAAAGWENWARLLRELSTSEPYNLHRDVAQALQKKIRDASAALEEIRARQLYSQRKFFAAASVVAAHPELLISYARHIKHRLIQ